MNKKKIAITISSEVLEKIEKKSEDSHSNRSSIINWICSNYFSENSKNKFYIFPKTLPLDFSDKKTIIVSQDGGLIDSFNANIFLHNTDDVAFAIYIRCEKWYAYEKATPTNVYLVDN